MLWQGKTYAGRDAAVRAEAAWRRAMGVDPTDPDAYLALITAEVARGRPERARQVYWEYRTALETYLDTDLDDDFEAACRDVLGSA